MQLLSLVGEQPVPNLLVARALDAPQAVLCCTERTRPVAEHLKDMLPGCRVATIEAYDLVAAAQQIEALCRQPSVINLTGGTKPMALAAYEVARQLQLRTVYLQSEGASNLLFQYQFQDRQPRLVEKRALGSLISIQDYLEAHGLRLMAEKGPQNPQESGLRRWLEQQVDECRSNLIFEAFEIDFMLRRGNQVAVLEAKYKKKSSRFGIDQLNTIAGREHLGTYTGKILVVNQPLGPQLSRLAEARHIQVVHVEGRLASLTGRLTLDQASRQRLQQALDRVLGKPHTGLTDEGIR